MVEKTKKRKKRQRRHNSRIEVDPTDYLEMTDAMMTRANLKKDEKRRQDYIV